MNENLKKILLGTVAAIAVVVAVFEGISFTQEPKLHVAYSIGHGTPGHGMKAAENAEAAAHAASPSAGDADLADALAGPNPTK